MTYLSAVQMDLPLGQSRRQNEPRNFAMTVRTLPRAFDNLISIVFVALSLILAGATAAVVL